SPPGSDALSSAFGMLLQGTLLALGQILELSARILQFRGQLFQALTDLFPKFLLGVGDKGSDAGASLLSMLQNAIGFGSFMLSHTILQRFASYAQFVDTIFQAASGFRSNLIELQAQGLLQLFAIA